MYLGLDGHILTFPVRNGGIINVVAFISDRSEPKPTWPADAPWVREASQREMLDAFAGWGDAARACWSASRHQLSGHCMTWRSCRATCTVGSS